MLNIIPYPNRVRVREGELELKGTICVRCPERYSAIAEKFTADIHRSLPSVHVEDEGDIVIDFNPVTDYGQEEYSLEVSAKGIDVRASKAPGFIYACQTLYQMMELHKFHAAGVKLLLRGSNSPIATFRTSRASAGADFCWTKRATSSARKLCYAFWR